MRTVAQTAAALAAGRESSVSLVEDALARLTDPSGEGGRAFTMVDPEWSLTQAREVDALRRAGRAPSPLAGLPVSIKALFDIAGRTTTAGSRVLEQAPPAQADAEAVRRLRAAGLVLMGHTNMTEFAYSGLGMNPHYGTPLSPFDRETGRIPGGSSSGAAVSVADGMAVVGLGTDTGGSCRIPAAFCGITGFKPTARRIPMAGTFPLAHSLDSIGPLAPTVACCAAIDAILAGETAPELSRPVLSDLRLAVLDHYVTDDMEAAVSDAFTQAVKRLERLGARVAPIRLVDIERLPEINARGGIIAAEAHAVHARMLAEKGERYDPRVRVRILRATEQHSGEYEALLESRREIIARTAPLTAGYDAVLFPTVPIQPPRLADLDADEDLYGRTNLLVLRNSSVVNFLDRCAVSIPVASGSGLPVGTTLMGETMGDRRLLAVANAVQEALGYPLKG